MSPLATITICWHAVAQLLEIVPAELHGPQLLDGRGQLGVRRDVLLLQHVLHLISTVFNGIQVWAIAWPVNNLKRLLSQEGFDPL
jgi:hypothetical protein